MSVTHVAFGIVCQFFDSHVTTLNTCAQAYSAFQRSGIGKSVLGSIRGFTLPLTLGQPRGSMVPSPNPRGYISKRGWLP